MLKRGNIYRFTVNDERFLYKNTKSFEAYLLPYKKDILAKDYDSAISFYGGDSFIAMVLDPVVCEVNYSGKNNIKVLYANKVYYLVPPFIDQQLEDAFIIECLS